MRYMIIVKGTKDSAAGVMPGRVLLAEMAAYHEQLARAGVLVDGSDCELEVRQMFELEDFEHGEEARRFRDLGMGGVERKP